jgi:hypothetical protein
MRIELLVTRAVSAVLLLCATACGSGADDAAGEDPGEPPKAAGPPSRTTLAPLDLTIDGEQVALKAPLGARGVKVADAYRVTKEASFQLEILKLDTPFSELKRQIADDPRRKVRITFTEETDDSLLYEATVGGQTRAHLAHTFSMNGQQYLCRDVRGPVFGKHAARRMLEACRSVRVGK